MEALGRHIIVEFYECESELLNDVVHIEESMIAAAETAGATDGWVSDKMLKSGNLQLKTGWYCTRK